MPVIPWIFITEKAYKIAVVTVSSFKRKDKVGIQALLISSDTLHLHLFNLYRQTNHVADCGNTSIS